MKSVNSKILMLTAFCAIAFTSCYHYHTVYYDADGNRVDYAEPVVQTTDSVAAAPKADSVIVIRHTVTISVDANGDTLSTSTTVHAPVMPEKVDSGAKAQAAAVQTTAPATTPATTATAAAAATTVANPRQPKYNPNDKYYLFDSQEAVRLWQKMRRSEKFSQEDFAEALYLCNTAYDYLTNEYQTILDSNEPTRTKKTRLANLDNGKGSEMINFCNTFSRRLYTCAVNGEMSDDNVIILNEMVGKKQVNKDALARLSSL